ncbi:MAG: hypothetical protein AABX32_03335 [Nanoarchaeota archaeon]
MFGLNHSVRDDLLKSVKNIIQDEHIFEKFFSRFEISIEHLNIDDISAKVAQDIARKEYSKALERVHKLIEEDMQLIHLLLELKRRGKINFNVGDQQKAFENIITIAKDLLANVQQLDDQLKEFLKQFQLELWEAEQGLAKNQALRQLQEMRELVRVYKIRIQSLVLSEKRDINKIEKELVSDIVLITSGKLVEIADGTLRIEIHSTSQIGQHNYPASILVFDNDFLVGQVALKSFDGNELQVSLSNSLIRGSAYVQKALELLLKSRKIRYWYSDDRDMTESAHKMYRRLDPRYFLVEKVQGTHGMRYMVSLR